MATLVTGGTGFVGCNIVKALASRGHDVICLDLVAPSDMVRKYLEHWSSQIEFVQGDILDPADLQRAASGRRVDRIVHAAAFTGIRSDIERDSCRSIVDVNVVGTANMLDLARSVSLERFMYVSSGSVYGEGRKVDEVLTEDGVLTPRGLYASTKYTAELLTRRYGELHEFPAVSVRLTSPFGPMERITGHRALMSVPYEWTGNVVRGEPIRVGDRSPGRDYTYVADSADAVCAVLDAPSLSHDVYNLSTGLWATLGNLADTLKALRPGIEVVEDPSVEFAIMRRGSSRGPMDSARLREDVGFKPRYDLWTGLEEYLRWRETFPFRD